MLKSCADSFINFFVIDKKNAWGLQVSLDKEHNKQMAVGLLFFP